jgi:hypothetical protein
MSPTISIQDGTSKLIKDVFDGAILAAIRRIEIRVTADPNKFDTYILSAVMKEEEE